MKAKAIKSVLKNGLITGIQSTCATLHLGFVYGANATEELEAKAIRRLTGLERLAVIKARRTNTIVKQQEHKEAAAKLRENIKKFTTATHKRSMDLVHEFGVFNKVQTEDVDYEAVN